MQQECLDQLGNWNPQFMRELKKRFTWRNVILILSITLLIQLPVLPLLSEPLARFVTSWLELVSPPYL